MLKRPLSLRTRLALGYTAFFVLVLTLLGVGVYFTVRDTLRRELELQLVASADLIQQDFDASNDVLSAYFQDPTFLLRTFPQQIEGLDSPTLYVQAVTPNGAIAISSPSLRGRSLPFDRSMRDLALAGETRSLEAQIGEARVLILVRPLTADRTIVGILQVGVPLREVDQTLRLLMISLVVAGVIVLIAGVRGGAWLAERALSPVGEIARTAQQIVRAEDLAQRVPVVPSDDELGQLAATINEMLERLEGLFTAQRRFVADVSHELRTPLTAMRGNLELLRRGVSRDPAALDESLGAMEREVNRLVRLAGDLLLLAQAEAGLNLRREPVALDELVLEVVRELRPLADGVALTPEIAEQVEVLGDRDRLKQALLNVVVNALQHTPAGGSVRVALDHAGGQARLRVSDTGVGIAREDVQRVFDRFYRADKARSRGTGGAGLGLAIVKWIVEAHGGGVEVASTPGQGSTFVLRLPLDQLARSPAPPVWPALAVAPKHGHGAEDELDPTGAAPHLAEKR
jgi:two-component system, OmpR family, sensor kinase